MPSWDLHSSGQVTSLRRWSSHRSLKRWGMEPIWGCTCQAEWEQGRAEAKRQECAWKVPGAARSPTRPGWREGRGGADRRAARTRGLSLGAELRAEMPTWSHRQLHGVTVVWVGWEQAEGGGAGGRRLIRRRKEQGDQWGSHSSCWSSRW